MNLRRAAATTATTATTAAAAAVLGVTGAALGLGGRALLRRQAAAARAVIVRPLGEQAPNADKTYRRRYAGPPLELLVLGNPIAAGLGADDRRSTLGARMAEGLAQGVQRRVRLTTPRRSARSHGCSPRSSPRWIPPTALTSRSSSSAAAT